MCSFIWAVAGLAAGGWYAYNTHLPAKKAVFGLTVQVLQVPFFFKEQVKK
jgi:hypothetical protein